MVTAGPSRPEGGGAQFLDLHTAGNRRRWRRRHRRRYRLWTRGNTQFLADLNGIGRFEAIGLGQFVHVDAIAP